jgi:hypothetical protein
MVNRQCSSPTALDASSWCFGPGRVGKLGPETLEELDEKLRLVLDL